METENFEKVKKRKLIAAITIDMIGMSSFALPMIGESGDLIWGPISGFLIMWLFPNYKKMALLGVVEEMLPFTDILPTALLAWRQEYKKPSEKTK